MQITPEILSLSLISEQRITMNEVIVHIDFWNNFHWITKQRNRISECLNAILQ